MRARSPRTRLILALVAGLFALLIAGTAVAADDQAKFYDFSDQLIDGDVKKPQDLVMETRTRKKFGRLLSLKRSFRQLLVSTAKNPILK
jgi:hypothetical protein